VDIRGRLDPGAGQACQFVDLARGVVDLDDAQIAGPRGLAVRKRIQPGPEDHVLVHAASNRLRQTVLCVPAPHYDTAPEGAGDGSPQPIGLFTDGSSRARVEEVQREWVIEDGRRVIGQEMRRPQPRRSQGCPAGGALGRGLRLGLPEARAVAHVLADHA
jgi:hypothetical protein